MAVSGAWILANGAKLAAGAGAFASVAQGMDSSRRAGNAVKDQEAAKLKAEADTSNNFNARIKMQRTAMQSNSLLTGGGAAAPSQTLGI